MKKIISFVFLLFVSLNAFSTQNSMVCSQINNLTDQHLAYTVNGKPYSLNPSEASTILALPDASKYQLLNGEITVYSGLPQMTVDGDFNFTYENGEIPNKINCSVFYRLNIYK